MSQDLLTLENIFMDYKTFGEHQWEDTGIFHFLRALPGEVLARRVRFDTPSQVLERFKPTGEIDVGDFSTISWADMERDHSAWLGLPAIGWVAISKN